MPLGEFEQGEADRRLGDERDEDQVPRRFADGRPDVPRDPEVALEGGQSADGDPTADQQGRRPHEMERLGDLDGASDRLLRLRPGRLVEADLRDVELVVSLHREGAHPLQDPDRSEVGPQRLLGMAAPLDVPQLELLGGLGEGVPADPGKGRGRRIVEARPRG
ncbi:MAG TPA: hypothetical protein VGS18_03990, partial [Thermoplasmata archaeon]|nr:hypothetical protein [Thermoplasmata archaeon]